ncbi:hypothetical protein C0Z19_04715 [Trinickia soli]|uniref:Uncharacterized protein n=1 Tax=Trinickia soli TaxID=380675 RepID=A0A2N7WCD6_9BURK|nr:hypothetical protein C0Z19_04715 [Trinickia soli]
MVQVCAQKEGMERKLWAMSVNRRSDIVRDRVATRFAHHCGVMPRCSRHGEAAQHKCDSCTANERLHSERALALRWRSRC